MSYHKLISCVLLALYGIPAAVGPYWHRHVPGELCDHVGQSSHCCCDVHAAASDPCLVDDHQHQNLRTRKLPATIQELVSAPTVDHCNICHFYACSGLPNADSPSSSVTGLVSRLRLDEAQPGAVVRFLNRARGPPLAS